MSAEPICSGNRQKQHLGLAFRPTWCERWNFNFDGKVMVKEHSFEWDNPSTSTYSESAYQGKKSIFSRVYAPVGVQFQLFNHFNLGLETNIRVGMQNVIGGKSYFMPITTGMQALVSYSF
jgi:hypothetical protein